MGGGGTLERSENGEVVNVLVTVVLTLVVMLAYSELGPPAQERKQPRRSA